MSREVWSSSERVTQARAARLLSPRLLATQVRSLHHRVRMRALVRPRPRWRLSPHACTGFRARALSLALAFPLALALALALAHALAPALALALALALRSHLHLQIRLRLRSRRRRSVCDRRWSPRRKNRRSFWDVRHYRGALSRGVIDPPRSTKAGSEAPRLAAR